MTSLSNDSRDRFQDILDAIKDLNGDIGSLTEREFMLGGTVERAVRTSLAVIGEAATALTRKAPQLQAEHPELWEQLRDAVDMRNFVIHRYGDIDRKIVWQTIATDIPKLQSFVRRLLDENDGSGGNGGGASGEPSPTKPGGPR